MLKDATLPSKAHGRSAVERTKREFIVISSNNDDREQRASLGGRRRIGFCYLNLTQLFGLAASR